ncbi:MAG: peptidyl-prolyl cis-trans isomerase D [Oceanospirillaceae bacterium]|jgi:peptidyl-prolyl cis-trans isomerase D
MLQGIRDSSKGIVAKVIVGFIVLTFAMFGVDSLVGLTQGSNAPATVNGEEITERDLYQATQLQRRSILAGMGEQADPSSIDDNILQSMVLDSLIQQKALLVEAADNDMRIADKTIDDIIVNTPEFHVAGVFNPAQFDATIRNAGFTRSTYRESVRKDQLIRQQRAGFALSSYVMPSTVKRIVSLDRQERDIRYFAMPIEKVRELTSVSDEEVKAEFEARKNSLNTTEQVAIEYVQLDQQVLLASIKLTDVEIDSEYQQIVANFESQEQRQAAHILIEVDDSVNDAAALEKLTAIKARIDAGEDFSTVAKEVSNDFGSAENGGDLGIVAKGTFEADFEQSLFSLAQSEISQPIKSESGYHLIKVLKIIASEAPSLTASKAKIIASLKTSKAEQLYLEQLEKLTDLAFISSDLSEIAAELTLEIKLLPAFTKVGGSELLSQNSKVIRAAFSDEVLKDSLNSAPLEIDQQNAVVIRVKEHLPVRAQAFEEVAVQLKDELLTKKASLQLEERALSAIQEIKKTGDATASAAGFELKTQLKATRISDEAPAEVINKAFSLPHPKEGQVSVDSVVLADQSLAIVIVDKVIDADLSTLSEEELKAINNALAARLGNQAYQTFVTQTQTAAEIERL